MSNNRRNKSKTKTKQCAPLLGMGVTCYGKGGRYPATIVSIDSHPKTGKPDTVIVQLDQHVDGKIVEDREGEIQEYLLNYRKNIWCRVRRKYRSGDGLMTLPWTHKNKADIFFGSKLSSDNSL